MNTEKTTDHLYINIMCGGGGKRLWPRSRQQAPKQFIKLFGEQTIFQKTVERVKKIVDPTHIFIVTNKDYRDEVAAQAPEIPQENVIAEPEAKNTALAVVYGALEIKKRDPEAIIANLPSDHFVLETDKFAQIIRLAYEQASSGNFLITIGIKPTFPHTGFGYIKKGLPKQGNNEIFEVLGFTEKPELEVAKEYLESQNYFWNGGIYVFGLKTFFDAVSSLAPDLWLSTQKLETAVNVNGLEEIQKIYSEAEDLSLDYAVAEKATNMLVIPGDFGWSDVGDWQAVWDVEDKDENGNVIIQEAGKGEHVGIDTKNCLIQLSDQLVTTIGVSNLIIIDTPDAVLVVSKDKAEEVKKLVGLLKEKGKVEYL
jgi:mannose-1-phosphate guanylyltransferase